MVTLVEGTDLAVSFRGVTLLDSTVSSKAEVNLWRHPFVGRILTINGEVQHVEKWQALYHEPLVHLSASFVPKVDRVLILGGGSLFAAAQVLLYPTVTSITLIDHDTEVLTMVERHYEHARRVLADARFRHVRANIIDYLEDASEQFDLVINDGFDIVQPPGSQAIHRLMANFLTSEGVCGDVTYRHLFDSEHRTATLSALGKLGPHALSLVVVPEYPGTLHLLTIWGSEKVSQKLLKPINRTQKLWCKGLPEAVQYFNPNYIPYYLYLPPYVQEQVQTSSDKDSPKAQFV